MARGVGLVLVIVGALLGAVAALVLAVTALPSSNLQGRTSDVVFALFLALPAALVSLLGVVAAVGSGRAAKDRRLATAVLALGAALVLPAVLGGLVGMLVTSGNDNKWACVVAGALGAGAALCVAGGGGAFARAAGERRAG